MSAQALYKRLREKGIICERRGEYVLILPKPLVIAQYNAYQFDEVTGEPADDGRIVFVAKRAAPFVAPRPGKLPLVFDTLRESVDFFVQNCPQQWLMSTRCRQRALNNDGNTALAQLRHDLHLIGKGGREVVLNPIKVIEEQDVDFVYQYGVIRSSLLDPNVFHNIRPSDMLITLYTMFYVPKKYLSPELLHNCIWKEDDSYYYFLASLSNRVTNPSRQRTFSYLLGPFFDLPSLDYDSLLTPPSVFNDALLHELHKLRNRQGFTLDVLYNTYAPAFCSDPFSFGRWIV